MRIKTASAFIFLGLLTQSLVAQDRSREGFNFTYIANPAHEFQAIDASIGYELKAWTGGYWAASFNLREADLKLNKISSQLHLKSYSLSFPVVHRFNPRWSMVASPRIAVKNASHSMIVNEDTIYPAGFFVANYRNSPDATGWSFTFGFAYSKDIDDHFFLPVVGAAFVRTPWRLNLGFPRFNIYYQPDQTWELGVKANFESGTHTLPSTSALKTPDEAAFRIRFIDIGPAFNFRVNPHIWINTNVGIVAYAEGHTVSAGGETKNLLFKGNNPIFVRASVSYY